MSESRKIRKHIENILNSPIFQNGVIRKSNDEELDSILYFLHDSSDTFKDYKRLSGRELEKWACMRYVEHMMMLKIWILYEGYVTIKDMMIEIVDNPPLMEKMKSAVYHVYTHDLPIFQDYDVIHNKKLHLSKNQI